MRVAALFVFVMGCASASPTLVASNAPAAPSAIHFDGPPIESATYSVKLYSHASKDPDNALPTAGGIVRIHAPIQRAYETAADFDAIYTLNPYIETSRVVNVVGSGPSAAKDVYIRVPTVIGEYVWAVVRFRPIQTNDGGWACKGEMIDGNLDDLRIFWRLVPSGNETLGQLELLADPALPLPRKWVLRDTKDGVEIMLERFRSKVEGHGAPQGED